MKRLAAVVAVLFVSGSAVACGIDEVAGKKTVRGNHQSRRTCHPTNIPVEKIR
jgi:hypothetical protein